MNYYTQNYKLILLPGESDKTAIHRLQPELLQKAWAEYHGGALLPSGELLSQRTASGKPYLPAHPDFHYNFSDSGDYLVLAVSPDHPIGVDLQKIIPIRSGPLKMAERFFHPDEIRLLSACKNAEEQYLLFFRIWTIKEAFLKCTGEGLSGGLSRFPIDFSRQRIGDCRFTELVPPEAGYFLTVCEPLQPSFS